MTWLVLVLIFASAAGSVSLNAVSRQEQQVFIEDILFRKILLSNGSTVVRWNRQPTLSIMGAGADEREAFEEALRMLDRSLRPVGYRIRRLPDGSAGADIEIYHTRFTELPALLEKLELPHSFAQMDRALGVYNEDRSLEKVYIFIDSSVAMTAENRNRRALRLLLAAMGLSGESRVPVQSIFFEVPPFGFPDELPSRLFPIDVKAIRLLYAYLEPGDNIETMRLKFQRQWRRLL